jgi:hypothetical protein
MSQKINTGLSIELGFLTPIKIEYLNERDNGGTFKLAMKKSATQQMQESSEICYTLNEKSSKFEVGTGNYTIRIYFESTSDKYKIEEQTMAIQINEGMTTVLKFALGSNYKSSLDFKKYITIK